MDGLLVRVSPEALCCVHQQDTILSSVLEQPRKTGKYPDMTEIVDWDQNKTKVRLPVEQQTDL